MIILTSVKQPEQGALFACHCPICKTTVIVANEFGVKPDDGDLWSVKGICMDRQEHRFQQSLAFSWSAWKAPCLEQR